MIFISLLSLNFMYICRKGCICFCCATCVFGLFCRFSCVMALFASSSTFLFVFSLLMNVVFILRIFLIALSCSWSSLLSSGSFNCAVSSPYKSFDLITASNAIILNLIGQLLCLQKRSSFFNIMKQCVIRLFMCFFLLPSMLRSHHR